MLWEKIKMLLREEDGYGTAELLILLAGVATIGYTISGMLVDGVFRPMHTKSVDHMTKISNSGY